MSSQKIEGAPIETENGYSSQKTSAEHLHPYTEDQHDGSMESTNDMPDRRTVLADQTDLKSMDTIETAPASASATASASSTIATTDGNQIQVDDVKHTEEPNDVVSQNETIVKTEFTLLDGNDEHSHLKDAVDTHDDTNNSKKQTNNDSEMEDLNNSGFGTSRPRRRTKNVNYKEKTESDIPTSTTNIPASKSIRRGRRSKSSAETIDSSSPPSSSSSSNLSYKNGIYLDIDQVVPINYQPPITVDSTDFNISIDLKGSKIDSSETTLTLKTGQKIKKGDCIYMICEPPSEPFYIAQVLGFTKKDKAATNRKPSNYMFSVCWFYRPRDLNRRAIDTRLVYASLHRDNCPLTSFRGFATVKHKSEINDLETYKQQPDCFFFDKLYDRYMIKMYDMIPTNQLVHLPPNYFKALHKRFEYIFVEVGKADELLSSPKNCEKCLQWCSSKDSISCSGCTKSYHLLCLDPPILTKPKRGFAWYCAACNKQLEDKLAKNRGKMLESAQPSMIKKIEELSALESSENETNVEEGGINEVANSGSSSLRYEQLAIKFLEDDKSVSLKKRREIEEWPYRYLGVHAKFEDALDIQDRPYARAASRLGAKYQCTTVTEWYDHTVHYYDPDFSSAASNSNNKRLKKYYNRSKKAVTQLVNDTIHDHFERKKFPIPEEYRSIKPKDFPGWLQPKPKGYIERGSDETSELLWKMPEPNDIAMSTEGNVKNLVDDYISQCVPIAERLKLATTSTPNFIDAILLILLKNDYDPVRALADAQKLTREALKEPTFSDEEIKRFEDSVRLNGSELYSVYKDVQTQSSAMVVRFYYLWKKTKNGHEIWDNFPGRAKNRLKATTKNVGIDLDNPDDDGSYSIAKINKTHVKFKCMYCETDHSPQWFRASGIVNDDEKKICTGLCYRCAKLWRKYAAKWENPLELIKNQQKKGSFVYKKKVEQELIDEAELVVTARENYKIHPIKVSEGVKQFRTIDSDYDFNNFGAKANIFPAVEAPAKVSKKRAPKKQPLVESTVSNDTADIEEQEFVEPKKPGRKPKKSNMADSSTKKPVENRVTKKRPIKEASEIITDASTRAEEMDHTENDTSDITEKPAKKKRSYNRKQPSDNNLKFVLVNDKTKNPSKSAPKKKTPTPAEEELNIIDDHERYLQMKEELILARHKFEENAKSNIFDAFLDMKLRENIEHLERDISVLALAFENNGKTGNDPANYPYVDYADSGANGSFILNTSESVLSDKQKYARRRLFLSKTSVPGTGVFETPPIKLSKPNATKSITKQELDLSGDVLMPGSSASIHTEITSNENEASNKFIFQMYKRTGDFKDTEFQSQPNLMPTNIDSSAAIASQDRKPCTDPQPFVMNKVSGETAPLLAPPSVTENVANKVEHDNFEGKFSKDETTLEPSKENENGEKGFLSGAIRNNEFVTFKPSFKVKMLTPLIDYNDSITKNMLSRYSSKYDVFNPLLSDDFYVSPIYQMRPASKELHILWKQYQTSRRSKGKLGKSFQPLYSPDKRTCCVCREVGDLSQVVICSNCGLNVHASCYGVELNNLDKDAGLYNWHCDPCSNDLHPLISTQYVCLLCNSRESNMDNAIKGDPSSIPDAMKRTLEGRWCHVSCSLLCKEVKYGSKYLQPVYGAPITGIKNIFKSCYVCAGNGGSIVSCEFCPTHSHVTCGLDFGWKMGFKFANIFDINDGDVIQLKDSEKIGKLVPIFYCGKHDVEGAKGFLKPNDLGMSLKNKKSFKPLIELYYQDERKQMSIKGNGRVRRSTFDQMRYEFRQLIDKSTSHAHVAQTESSNLAAVTTDSHICSKCWKSSSLMWYQSSETNAELCQKCHNNENQTEFDIPDLSKVNTRRIDCSALEI